MLSKNKIKFLHSLEMKKNRDAQQSFVAEGPKIVHDILSRHKDQLSVIAATEEWFARPRQSGHHHPHCRLVRHRGYYLQ